MLFGGTFEPAYVMKVTALQSQLLPATNKRNAALIQRHMEEAIGVSPARGFLQFIPTLEENMAVNGRTLAAEMDDLERNGSLADDVPSLGSRRSKTKKKLSVRVSADEEMTGGGGLSFEYGRLTSRPAHPQSIGNFRPSSVVAGPAPELTPPASASDGAPPVSSLPAIPGTPDKASTATGPRHPTPAARRKKSFVASIFGRRHEAR